MQPKKHTKNIPTFLYRLSNLPVFCDFLLRVSVLRVTGPALDPSILDTDGLVSGQSASTANPVRLILLLHFS